MSSTAALPFPLPGLRIYDTAASEPARSAALAALASASDNALVERVSRGDRDAFALLYRRYERPVFAVLLRLGGQRALAEEWLQEAFTRERALPAEPQQHREDGPLVAAVEQREEIGRAHV